jgi:putative copper export protein
MQQRPLIDRLHRFTRIAVLAIPVLILAGGWLALNIAGSFDALVTTAYGRVLLVKLAAASGALLLGTVNKQIVAAKVSTRFRDGTQWLRLTLTGDAVLFAIAIGLVAWVTTVTGPPDS